MDYAYQHVNDARDRIVTSPQDWPTAIELRKQFQEHLALVSEALRAIEWVDSGDSGVEVEEAAIRACLVTEDELRAKIAQCDSMLARLDEIEQQAAAALARNEVLQQQLKNAWHGRRERISIAAMQAMLQAGSYRPTLAHEAVQMADAMIKELQE